MNKLERTIVTEISKIVSKMIDQIELVYNNYRFFIQFDKHYIHQILMAMLSPSELIEQDFRFSRIVQEKNQPQYVQHKKESGEHFNWEGKQQRQEEPKQQEKEIEQPKVITRTKKQEEPLIKELYEKMYEWAQEYVNDGNMLKKMPLKIKGREIAQSMNINLDERRYREFQKKYPQILRMINNCRSKIIEKQEKFNRRPNWNSNQAALSKEKRKELYLWIMKSTKPVTKLMVREKAKQMSGRYDFRASPGWFAHYMRKYPGLSKYVVDFFPNYE